MLDKKKRFLLVVAFILSAAPLTGEQILGLEGGYRFSEYHFKNQERFSINAFKASLYYSFVFANNLTLGLNGGFLLYSGDLVSGTHLKKDTDFSSYLQGPTGAYFYDLFAGFGYTLELGEGLNLSLLTGPSFDGYHIKMEELINPEVDFSYKVVQFEQISMGAGLHVRVLYQAMPYLVLSTGFRYQHFFWQIHRSDTYGNLGNGVLLMHSYSLSPFLGFAYIF